MDSYHRSLAKTLTYRLLGMVITAGVAWLLTREMCFAACVGVLDTCVKFGGYYLHERIWELTNFGRTPYAASGRVLSTEKGREDRKWRWVALFKKT